MYKEAGPGWDNCFRWFYNGVYNVQCNKWREVGFVNEFWIQLFRSTKLKLLFIYVAMLYG